MNYFMVSYDLYTPGQKYNDLIEEIEGSPNWAKVMLSCFIVGTNESAAQLNARLRTHLDTNDYIIVIRICDDYDGWFQTEVHTWIRQNVPAC